MTKVIKNSPKSSAQAVSELVKIHGLQYKPDIKRGVKYAQLVWEGSGGDFIEFCKIQYIPPGKERINALRKLDHFLGAVYGNFGVMYKVTREGIDIADTPLTAADQLLGSFSGSSHLDQDFRDFKVTPLIQLLFGSDDPHAPKSRDEWAAFRMRDIGREKVPAAINSKISKVISRAHVFVSSFNLELGNIKFPDSRVKIPKGTFQVSHWGLRDYITSQALIPGKLPLQRAVRDIMQRVVDGGIPEQMVNSKQALWDIKGNSLRISGKTIAPKMIGAKRWSVFKDSFDAVSAADPFTRYGNIIDNAFKGARRMEEKRIEKILIEVLSSDAAQDVARFIRKTLKRPLEAHDIYFKDFQRRKTAKQKPLSLGKRFPSALALQKAIPEILVALGFTKQKADYIGSKIRVDNTRSAGHAFPPYTKTDLQLCRVRVGKEGVDEQGFSTFMHELGHCVEGVLTTYNMDYHILWHVPNTAFTEAFAFTFQDKADFVLGRKTAEDPAITLMQRFWDTYEISGPALVEMRLFRWLYKNKRAGAASIQKKVREIGDEIWKKYYARVLGKDGFGLMSVYSHMLDSSFYLAEYPMGHVIGYQIRRFLKDKNLGLEMERICSAGSIDPDPWMQHAVGEKVSVKPLLQDLKNI
jgi:hypothetical protein